MSLESLQRRLPDELYCRRLEQYFNDEVRLDALGVNLPPEVRVLEMVAPYPRMSIEVLAEVLTFIGYTFGDNPDDTRLDYLDKVFQLNNMETIIRLALIEALVQGGTYFVVGPGRRPGDKPRVTAHQYQDVVVERDAFGTISEALIRWSVGTSTYDKRQAHYTPGLITVRAKTRYGWEVIDQQPTGVDRVTVVPMLNKARLSDTQGRSEMLQILTVSDAASRTLTGLQIAQELEVLPKKWLFADGAKEAFGGNAKAKLEAAIGNVNFGPEGGSITQLPGASLDSVINVYKLYAQIISSVTGIPPSMLGISTDNPASAEAMRVAKDRLSSRGETKQDMFGDALEELARLVLEVGQQDTDGTELLQTVWRDVATPSRTAQQAIALQAFQAGAITKKTMRDFIDLTPAQRQYENEMDLQTNGMPARKVDTRALVNAERVPVGDTARVPAASAADDAERVGS